MLNGKPQSMQSFTAWVNTHLLKVGKPIDDLETGFKDGLKLIKLVEVISNEHLRKPEKGKMRLHHIQNVNISLDGIAARGVKVQPLGLFSRCPEFTRCLRTIGVFLRPA